MAAPGPPPTDTSNNAALRPPASVPSASVHAHKRQHPNFHAAGASSSSSSSKPPSAPGTPTAPSAAPAASFDDLQFPYCDDLNSKYQVLMKIGEGTFGEVFKARNKKTSQQVALKKVRMENEKEGFPITALREIKILQHLQHENVMPLIEICRYRRAGTSKARCIDFYLVCDFCEHDAAGLLRNKQVRFSLSNIKTFMQQVLQGLYYMHLSSILHRDMKAANILITKEGKVKLADFGLARVMVKAAPGKPNAYTNRVVTLWYRPPELLLGERNYGPPIDIWGTGCIMAEMFTRNPIMQGSSEAHQLELISKLCGSIDISVWPNVTNLPLYDKMTLVKGIKRKVKERLRPHMNDVHSLDLIDQLLCLDPAKRFTADMALNHDFFYSNPLPSEPEFKKMLSQYSKSMFEYHSEPRRSIHPAAGMGQRPAPNRPLLNQDSNFEKIF